MLNKLPLDFDLELNSLHERVFDFICDIYSLKQFL